MVEHNEHCLGKVRTVRTGTSAKDACTMITGVMKTTRTKVLEMLLDLPTLGMAVEFAALKATYHLPWLDLKNLGIEHTWI